MSRSLGDAFDAYGDWDEDDIRVRPNPKANKPRSKQRPKHADAVTGPVEHDGAAALMRAILER